MKLRDSVAIVTGASSGIGKATVELFAAEGGNVGAFARSGDKLDLLAQRFPDRVLPVTGDAADEADVARLFHTVRSHFGEASIVVNNAGIVDRDLLESLSSERWDRTFAVNVRSMFLTSREALPSMKRLKRGAIVNIASISGVPGPEKFPGFVSYCASKGAIVSFTEALAAEVKEHFIRVNCISPGSVDTAMWHSVAPGVPANMTPEEIARIVLFLATDESRPMNGQNLHAYSI